MAELEARDELVSSSSSAWVSDLLLEVDVGVASTTDVEVGVTTTLEDDDDEEEAEVASSCVEEERDELELLVAERVAADELLLVTELRDSPDRPLPVLLSVALLDAALPRPLPVLLLPLLLLLESSSSSSSPLLPPRPPKRPPN